MVISIANVLFIPFMMYEEMMKNAAGLNRCFMFQFMINFIYLIVLILVIITEGFVNGLIKAPLAIKIETIYQIAFIFMFGVWVQVLSDVERVDERRTIFDLAQAIILLRLLRIF